MSDAVSKNAAATIGRAVQVGNSGTEGEGVNFGFKVGTKVGVVVGVVVAVGVSVGVGELVGEVNVLGGKSWGGVTDDGSAHLGRLKLIVEIEKGDMRGYGSALFWLMVYGESPMPSPSASEPM